MRSRPATSAISAGTYKDVARIEKVDAHTARIVYKAPNPAWFQTFGGTLCVLPRHVFEPFKGAKSREAPANMKPVGTGPYRIVDFKPNDVVLGELNPNYHAPNWPFFDRIEVKGGGDAASAARAARPAHALVVGPPLGEVDLEVALGGVLGHGIVREGPG